MATEVEFRVQDGTVEVRVHKEGRVTHRRAFSGKVTRIMQDQTENAAVMIVTLEDHVPTNDVLTVEG